MAAAAARVGGGGRGRSARKAPQGSLSQRNPYPPPPGGGLFNTAAPSGPSRSSTRAYDCGPEEQMGCSLLRETRSTTSAWIASMNKGNQLEEGADRRAVTSFATASDSSGMDADIQAQIQPFWGELTMRLTASSTFPFLFLMMPQVWKNAMHMLVGNGAALSVISWAGYMSGMLGNLLLFSYFVSIQEWGATLVQAVGVISTAVLLTQVFIAGYFPSQVFWPLAGIICIGVTLGSLKLLKLLDEKWWRLWQSVLGVIGLATLPQTMWAAFAHQPSVYPALIGAAVGGLLFASEQANVLPVRFRGLQSLISAWTATLLFMMMPIPQLMNNFNNPASTQAISIMSVLLGLSGNALMIPRALYTRDIIWFVGSSWGATVMGWAQLLSITLAGFMHPGIFCLCTGIFCGYIFLVCWQDSVENKLGSPLGPLEQMFRKKLD